MGSGTRSQQSGAAAAAQAAPPARDGGARQTAPEKSRAAGYGLPCSKCHQYYPAHLDVCPTCKHTERVSPVIAKKRGKRVQTAPEPKANSALLEREREEFLRQFKAQLLETHAEGTKAPGSVCKFGEHHAGEPGIAEICASCYERVQERTDACEAALHMDVQEAAQIVYDAVWADPTNASKTYENAASALLTELRKRAGITTGLGTSEPLVD